jgi:hypothetical protein
MIPEQQLNPVLLLELIHPVEPPPLVGIGDNQAGDRIQVDLAGEDDVKGGFVERKKTVDIGIDVFRANGNGAGINQGGGDNGRQPVKIGVAMGGGYVHGISVEVVCSAETGRLARRRCDRPPLLYETDLVSLCGACVVRI